LLLAAALLLACDQTPPFGNHAPTVVITSGPDGTIAADSCRFSFLGTDIDGAVTGYYYGLDDSTPDTWVADTFVELRQLPIGRHEFFVQSVDDSAKRSNNASRTFWVNFDSSVTPRGTDSTLEIVTWNIENFPKDDDSTVNKVRALMARLDLDIYCLQEIADTLAFQELLSGLAGYAGFYSRDDYGSFYQKTGVVYKTSVVRVNSTRQLFWGNDSVTRPPLEADVTASANGRTFDFKLIVQHLKAGGSSDDFAQRRATCRLLKEYIDSQLGGGDEDFVVVGDWNDLLTDPRQENIFQQFLDDSTDYRMLTWPIRNDPLQGSYISSGALIDHLMVSADALAEYGAGRTYTLRLDDEVYRYESVVSDHRPVMSVFQVFSPTR